MKKILLSGLVAGIVMLVIAVALSFAWQFIFPSVALEYATPLFRPWSDPLMSLIFVCPLLTGFFLAWIWSMVKGCHQGSASKKVLLFATGWTIFSFLGIFMTYSCFQMSFLMMLTWVLSSATQYYFGTWVLIKMNK
ncbi:MAG: hypothetical protein WC702_00450 [Patescibacteria group bacterium]|jgi:hypothetical protein